MMHGLNSRSGCEERSPALTDLPETYVWLLRWDRPTQRKRGLDASVSHRPTCVPVMGRFAIFASTPGSEGALAGNRPGHPPRSIESRHWLLGAVLSDAQFQSACLGKSSFAMDTRPRSTKCISEFPEIQLPRLPHSNVATTSSTSAAQASSARQPENP